MNIFECAKLLLFLTKIIINPKIFYTFVIQNTNFNI